MKLINHSYLFDFVRNFYADLSYSDPLGRARIPLRYFLEVTYRCNLKCPYCYVGNDRNKDELTLAEWKNVISQVPRYGIITLVGGEPFLRKDFKEIMDFASKRVWGKVNVVANGTLLTEDNINALIKSKIILLSVSLDGWGTHHDKNRNKEGIFDKITASLENVNFKRKKSPLMIDIKTIVLENNLEDIYELYKYCTKEGFEFLSISFLRNNNLKQNSVLLDDFDPVFYEPNYDIKPYFDVEHFIDVYKRIDSLSKKSNTLVRFSPKFEGGSFDEVSARIKKFFSDKNRTKHPKDIYYPCKYPYSNIMINPSGDVYPCLSFKIGNVKEKTIKELFNEPKYRCFRKNLKCTGGSFSSCQMCCELKVKD